MTVADMVTGAQALASDVKILGKSKIITAARANDASGDVAYSGVGFKPRTIIALAYKSISTEYGSIGFADENLAEQDLYIRSTAPGGDSSYVFGGEAFLISLFGTINSSTAFQKAVLLSLDADGFTLTLTKGATGSSGNLAFLCLG